MSQQETLTTNEFNTIILTIKQMQNDGTAMKDPDFSRLIEVFKAYNATQTGQTIQTPSNVPLPNAPKAQFKPEQLNILRYQIMAYKYLSRNQPIPQPVQQALDHLMKQQNQPPASPTKQKMVDVSVTKALEPQKEDLLGDLIDPYSHLKNVPYLTAHRLLIPSIMPQGLDPISLAEEREQQIQSRIMARIAELESLIDNLPTENLDLEVKKEQASTKIKALIELKSLKLLEKQKRMRNDLVAGMKAATTLQTSVSRSEHRRIKKPSLREIRFTEKMEKQQRMEREKKEKQKHYDYLNSIVNHGKDMLAHRRGLVQKQIKLGRAILHWHNTVEKEEQKRQERLTKERIKALKADDEEAYMKLIDKQKDTRITHLLQQTNQYLDALSSLVVAQKEDTALKEGIPVVQPIAPPVIMDDEDNDKTDYYSIAHQIQEKVTEQPSILNGGTLKDYQLKGLEWLVSLYNNKLNGILADEMGLGKTIQTISLIAFLMEKKNQNGPFLIIVPLSTITNWTLEFEKWAPSITKVVYKGSPNQRREIQLAQMRQGTFNVLLTTYEYIIKDKSVLGKYKWCHTIIDEGHRMKNTSSKLSITLTQFYSTRYRIILTGTPLQNNLPELWALLNFVLPKIFNSVKSFDEWFNTPFQNTGEKIELNEEEQLLVIKRLHKVLRPFLLRRLKKDVEADLPDKVERVLKTPLSALQQKLYNQIRRSGAILISTSNEGKKSGNIKSINNTIMQLRKVCNHPYVFENVEENICPQKMTDENIYRVSGKFELLDRVLPKFHASGHRVLIFFQMTAVMDIMEDFLRFKGLKYLRLDGSTKAEDRSSLLKLFNAPNSDYFAFILSTRAGGLGLNLQSADTVIIFDSDWNPHQDLQAQDRAHRIGQTKEVRIFRLISANSIEENILARAQYKLDLDGKVIQAGKFDNKSTNEERDEFLRSLFDTNPEEANDVNDVDDDDELNEIISRNDEELEAYKKMDVERKRQDQHFWNVKLAKPGSYPRLISLEELPEIYTHDTVPVEREEHIEYGRGQRARNEVRYNDGLTDDQWARAVDQDIDPDELAERKLRRREKKRLQRGGEEKVSKKGIKRKQDRYSSESDMDSFDDEDDESDNHETSQETGKRKKIRVVEDEDILNDQLPPDVRQALQSLFKSCLDVVKNSVEVLDDGSERLRSALFLELPSKKYYPDYYHLIKAPIALDIISSRIDSYSYKSVKEFENDFELMFKNAMTYNVEGSMVYEDAEVLKQEFETELQKMLLENSILKTI